MKLSESIKEDPKKNVSLGLLPLDNKGRQFLLKVSNSKIFEYTILFFILASSIFMALENPLDSPSSLKNTILYWCDLVVTVIFSVEVAIKVLAKGLLLNGHPSYLRSIWNILDFLIILVSIIALFANNNQNLKVFKVFRLLRVLRPLRVIGRNQGLKLALQTLLTAIPNILNVLFVSCIFYLIFGIFCVSFLQGQYYHCYFD